MMITIVVAIKDERKEKRRKKKVGGWSDFFGLMLCVPRPNSTMKN